jgi:hypothetical protein
MIAILICLLQLVFSMDRDPYAVLSFVVGHVDLDTYVSEYCPL